MKTKHTGGPRLLMVVLILIAVLGLCGLAWSMVEMKKPKTPAGKQKAAYQLFQKKCLSCHVSVADPERPGKTRDEWVVVVKFMDKHFVNLSDAEADLIIDLLYSLRPGVEKEAG